MKHKALALFLAGLLALGSLLTASAAGEPGVIWVGELDAPWSNYDIFRFSEGLALVTKDDKFGYVDTDGQIVIPLKYDDAYSFRNGLACVYSEEEGLAYIDKTGEVVVSLADYPLDYNNTEGNDAYSDLSAGIICLCYYKAYGVPPVMWGAVDLSGNVVVPFVYDACSYRNGMFTVCKDGKYGFLDRSGEIAIPLVYDDASSFSEGLACVQKGEKWGYIDQDGQVVIPFELDSCGTPCESGIFFVAKDGKYGMLSRDGSTLLPAEYSSHGWFSEGLAAVKKDGKWGYVDRTGQLVIPTVLEYDSVDPFSEGLAQVSMEIEHDFSWADQFGYIDTTGRLVIPMDYISFGYSFRFSCGVAGVTKEDPVSGELSSGYIDRFGNEVVPFAPIPNIWSGIGTSEMTDNLGISYVNDTIACVDNTGQVVIPAGMYDDISYISEGMLWVKKDDVWGIVKNPAYNVKAVALRKTGTADALRFCYAPQDSQLTLTEGAIPSGHRVAIACYNEKGKFVDIKLLTAGQASAQLEPGTASVKLFWLDGALKPQSTPGSLKF